MNQHFKLYGGAWHSIFFSSCFGFLHFKVFFSSSVIFFHHWSSFTIIFKAFLRHLLRLHYCHYASFHLVVFSVAALCAFNLYEKNVMAQGCCVDFFSPKEVVDVYFALFVCMCRIPFVELKLIIKKLCLQSTLRSLPKPF